MNIFLTCLGLALIQLLLARGLGAKTPRAVAWLGVLAAFYYMHHVAIEAPSLIRMIILCIVLLAGMKWIVYREWSAKKNRKLSWSRWWMFSALWFGMDPGCFAGRRKDCEWRSHAVTGASCVLVGGLLWYLCYYLQLRNVVLLFIPMSTVVHFGSLRLLTAFWRMQGFPVRVLFRNPLKMRGFRDFWGRRWNLAYSEMMARTVKQPLTPILGEKWSVLAVFFISGLLHELAITVPVQAGYGLPTLIFVIHGLFTMREKKNAASNALFCAFLLVIGLPYLFNEKFQIEVILPSRDVFKLTETLK